MNLIEYNPFKKIKERDGLLIVQLYQLMPEDKRPSYSHFRRVIQKERGAHMVLARKPSKKSETLFLTADRGKMKTRKMNLMIYIAEWEIYYKKRAS